MTRLLFLVFVLSVVPASIGAQCRAWVLWEENVAYKPTDSGFGSGQTTWSLKSAYETRRVCDDEAAKSMSDAVLQGLKKADVEPDKIASFSRSDPSWQIVIRYKDGARRILDWKCLPDSVDPRPR